MFFETYWKILGCCAWELIYILGNFETRNIWQIICDKFWKKKQLRHSDYNYWTGCSFNEGGTSPPGAGASADLHQSGLMGAQEFSYKVKRWQVDQSGGCPVLQSSVNVEWFTFDPQIFSSLFTRLYEGIIINDVFIRRLQWLGMMHLTE